MDFHSTSLNGLSILNQPFGGILTPVQQHILHILQQFLWDIVINPQKGWVHNSYVHPRLYSVI